MHDAAGLVGACAVVHSGSELLIGAAAGVDWPWGNVSEVHYVFLSF